LTLGLLGEAPSIIPATREATVRVSPARGLAELSGILGAYVYPAGESLCDVVSHSSLSAVVLTVASGEILPVAEELKLVIEVNRIASLSCDGQEGKLVDVLGQIVAKKHGKDIGGVRASHNFNEA
jgi:hypothetical protein